MGRSQSNKIKEWENFLNLFMGATDKRTLDMLFQLFMTGNEREMLIDRYRLVKSLLLADSPQREIANQLHLSISKVTAGSKAVQTLSDPDKRYLIKKVK